MLQDLPFELLIQIVAELPNTRDVARLSRCNRALHQFVKTEGWKIFVQTRFPSIPVRANWQAAAHSLTCTSRNYDRKAFIARYVEPSNFLVKLPGRELETQWRKPRGQTMGYQPVIDSYEESTGGAWEVRRQVLAWSAGSELVLRIKEMGGKSLIPERRGTYSYLDHHGHRTRWFTYKPPKAIEGRDDITCLKLLKGAYREENNMGSSTEHIIFGTASGKLFLIHLEMDRSSHNTLGSVFETGGRPVRSADVSPNQDLLAASLSDTDIALYKVPEYLYNAPEVCETVEPISERSLSPEGEKSCRTWSIKFLSDSLLAVGLGPSHRPLHVYLVTRDGLSKDPIWQMVLNDHVQPSANRVDGAQLVKESQTSVYPIVPLLASSQAGHSPGEVFLSGSYDGIIRLHDLRASRTHGQCYFDPGDDAAIYSLQALGRERIVVGSSRHSMLKFWDLRMSGGRKYHYKDLATYNKKPYLPGMSESGWNLFLNPRNTVQPSNVRPPRWRRDRSTESPVYSLSSPSAYSPSIFAGVENNVVELEFVSMLDKHPDPIYAKGLVRDQRGNINVIRSWNPKNDVLNFAMYEQPGAGDLRLKTQAGVGQYAGVLNGYDERWRDGGSTTW